MTMNDIILKMLKESNGFMSARLLPGLLHNAGHSSEDIFGAIHQLTDLGQIRREERDGYEVGVYVLSGEPPTL